MDSSKYTSIRRLAARGPVSEYGLRRMLRQHMLPGIYVGKKYLVNVEQFDAMLDSISASAVNTTYNEGAQNGMD